MYNPTQTVAQLIDNATHYAGEPWPEPQPLTESIAPEPYPLDALPETLRYAVEEVQGFVKAPPPLVACSALAALSVAAQALVDVKRAEKLTGPSGLFFLTIADSGERKSTCDGFFTKAIREYECEQAELAKPELEKYRADIAAWEAEKSGITEAIKAAAKKNEQVDVDENKQRLERLENRKPEPPRIPKLIRGDDTPENLAWALMKEWPSAGILSSEAGLIFGAHAMGRDSIMRNLGLLNLLWDGGSLSIGRRTSESFTVRGARLTVGLMIQEATLQSFFDRSEGLPRGTGFLARFLVAWPESTQGTRTFTEAPQAWPALARFNRRIAEILAHPVRLEQDGSLAPEMLETDPSAKALWIKLHDTIEAELRSGGELYDVRDVAAKTADNAVRLAALFHVLEHGPSGAIGATTFEGASRIAMWHLTEARRFFGELALPEEQTDAARLDAWLIDQCRKQGVASFSRREIQRNITPSRLRDGKRLAQALRELQDLGRLRELTEGKQKLLHINPALLKGESL